MKKKKKTTTKKNTTNNRTTSFIVLEEQTKTQRCTIYSPAPSSSTDKTLYIFDWYTILFDEFKSWFGLFAFFPIVKIKKIMIYFKRSTKNRTLRQALWHVISGIFLNYLYIYNFSFVSLCHGVKKEF